MSKSQKKKQDRSKALLDLGDSLLVYSCTVGPFISAKSLKPVGSCWCGPS